MPLLQTVIYALFLECWDGLRSSRCESWRDFRVVLFNPFTDEKTEAGEVVVTCLKPPVELHPRASMSRAHALHMEGAQQMLAAEVGRWGPWSQWRP